MELTIRAKNFKLAGDIEASIQKRMDRLTRHLDNLLTAEVLLSQTPTRLNPQRFDYVAQITLQTRNNIIRSEVSNSELLSAVDESMDHLNRQVERHRTRLDRKKRGAVGLGKAPMNSGPELPSLAESATASRPQAAISGNGAGPNASYEDETGEIVRVKSFTVKPMFPEDAIEQMELLGHGFYVFYNAADDQVNVVYRRNDGNYGLIQPEFS